MKKLHIAGMVFLMLGLVHTAYSEDIFTVGEKWIYSHEGPVPMRPPDFALNGDRIREVVEARGEGEDKRWLIDERWGQEDNWAGKFAVDAKRMYAMIEYPENRKSSVEPALPFDVMDLKDGEEKSFASTFTFGENFSFPMKVKVKRLKNETIKVPAGEYADCMHIEMEDTFTFTGQDGNERTMTSKRERWYHQDVNGFVKEIYSLQTPDGESRKGTSQLKSYTKK